MNAWLYDVSTVSFGIVGGVALLKVWEWVDAWRDERRRGGRLR